MAGAIAFLALGLHHVFPGNQKVPARIREFICWTAIAFGVILAGSQNRGALLAVLTSVALVVVFRPMSRMKRLILPVILVVTVLTVIDFRIQILFGGREYSVQQIALNFQSIFFPSSILSLANTTEWRMEWWKTIFDYTLFGDYFWTGKGYGINLAVNDDFVTFKSNRSPHSAHFTILARSGVPGLIFWCILQATILIVLLRHYFTAQRAGKLVLANVNLWLLAYWLALIVNMSFDVYLEGPQGGIWFWCLVGFIIALTLSQDALETTHARVGPARSDYGLRGPHVRDPGTL